MSAIGMPGGGIALAAVILLLTAGLAEARGGGSRGGGSSGGSRSYSSHSYSSHSYGSHSGRAPIGFGRGTCTTAACRGKHPTGTFSYPIFPKKHSQ